MKKFFYKSIIYLLLLSLLTNVGCYTYSSGALIGYNEVPNSQILKNNKYDYDIVSKPSFDNPQLVLSFKKIPVYQYTTIEIYNEIKTPKKGASKVSNTLFATGIISLVVGGLIGLDTTASESRKKTGGIVAEVGASAMALGFLIYLISPNPDKVPEVTGKRLLGDSVIKNRDGEPISLIDKTVSVNIEQNNKTYSTTSKGEICIDLVKDFGLASFDKEKDIYVKFEIPINNGDKSNSKSPSLLSKNIRLKSSDWTKKYFSIIADEINVYDSPGTSEKKLGICKKTEQYKVLDSNSSGWTKIDYNGRGGWISSYAGQYIWLAK